jgi:hypothetical protein
VGVRFSIPSTPALRPTHLPVKWVPGRFLLCVGEESKSHLLLKYPETQRWREEFLRSKWLQTSEDIALRKIPAGSKGNEWTNLCDFTYKIKCKWENQVKKVVLRLREREELDCT